MLWVTLKMDSAHLFIFTLVYFNLILRTESGSRQLPWFDQNLVDFR